MIEYHTIISFHDGSAVLAGGWEAEGAVAAGSEKE